MLTVNWKIEPYKSAKRIANNKKQSLEIIYLMMEIK